MKQIITICLAGLISVGAATAASAGEAKLYASINASYNSYDDVSGVKDDNVWGYGGLVGAEFATSYNGITIAPEAGYQDFGTLEASIGSNEANITGLTAGVKIALPITQNGATRIVARGGSLWWDMDVNAGADVDGQDWYYGGGLDHLLTENLRIGVDAQFQTLRDNGGDLDFFSTSLRATFTF